MENAFILEVVGGGILAVLVLKEVKAIVMYAVARRNGKLNGNSGTREVFIKQDLRDVLSEMFTTLQGMQSAIEASAKAHSEGMKEVCDTLKGLTGEVKELKGKVSK
jgi:hypothetical protein